MGNGAFFCDGGLRIICTAQGAGNSGHGVGFSKRGFALAIYNARRGRFVVPMEFVRQVCKAVALSAAVERIRREFAGYLVSEPVEPFVPQRVVHDLSCEPELITGGCMPDRRFSGDAGGPLDAPEFMPAGGCDEAAFLFGGGMPSQSVKRGAGFAAQWFDNLRAERPFSESRAKHSNERGVDRLTVTGYGKGWHVEAREGFDCTLADLSAPEYIAAGALECGVATRFGQRGWQQITARH